MLLLAACMYLRDREYIEEDVDIRWIVPILLAKGKACRDHLVVLRAIGSAPPMRATGGEEDNRMLGAELD